MRALLPLPSLLLLAVAAAGTAAGTAVGTASVPAPPALLVLRSACIAHDSTAFIPPTDLASRAGRPVRVLSSQETCGPGWSRAVTRASLAALSGGGAVGVSGGVGAAACGALAAAARALRVPAPAASECAAGQARGTAVARLAARRGWRRALLQRPPPHTECRTALQDAARALTAQGLTAEYAPLHPDQLTASFHVAIVCASRMASTEPLAGAALATAAATVLLLHVDEPSSTSTAPAAAARTLRDTPTTNTDIFVNTVHDISGRVKSSAPVVQASDGFERRNSDFQIWTSKTNSILRTKRRRTAVDNDTTQYLQKRLNFTFRNLSRRRRKVIPARVRRSDYLFSYVDKILPRGDLLLLSGERLDEDRPSRDLERTYADAFEALERAAAAASSGVEVADFTFHLYRRRMENDERSSSKWEHVCSVETRSSRALDDVSEWKTEVRAMNGSEPFASMGPEVEGAGGGGARGGAGAASLAGGAGAALAAAVALAARWAAARRRRSRRGGDAVLAPQDFTFPLDERRCVGEGMETMLSCWLQQLHEFGGPDLERPDLLKQPSAPSAPSSTCSVNRIALDRRIRYKGDAVHLKLLETGVAGLGAGGGPTGGESGGGCALELKRKAVDVLLVMQSLRHENLNPFIGCLCEVRPALVWDYCGRGSLEDVLMADDIKLDWTFRLSLLTDLVRAMRYLHASPLRVHGRLSSRNCVVDSRWVLRLTDYGLPALRRAHRSHSPPAASASASARDLLWTAPELLRDEAARARGSQPGDVYSFAIVMQEVIVRGEPYCMLSLSPEEIVEKLRRPPPLIRPSVSMGAAPPEAVSVMRQCWTEAPDARPDFHTLHDLFRHLHRGRKVNIVDSMFEMLEKYSNNLEELIKERTEQLDMEKKKTEQLLNRMLPRSVAERLLAGSRVEPEEFSEVTVYFSDIVGFTALAARSEPVQVVDLLNDLYTTFDGAIERYRVYKVETIGDAYMVVGGLPARTADHAESVATMALHLLHLAGRFRVRHLPDTPLHLRIGLHSGPCCAAVVGLTMPRYCLFGDTVNTASRMESTGAAWRIQVSAATADRLAAAGGFRLRSRGLVMIKGKGAMHTYWLLGKDGFDKPLPVPPPLESEEVLFETDAENESETSSGPPSATGLSAALASNPVQPSPVLVTPSSFYEKSLDPNGRTELSNKDSVESGAVSAGSSPPAPARAGGALPRVASALSVDRPAGAAYARYRWAAGAGAGAGAGALRRQWSLERGEALACAAAGSAPAGDGPGAPLALLAAGPAARAAPARYRTRPAE